MKLLSVVVLFFLCLTSVSYAKENQDIAEGATAAIAMEMISGRVLFAKQAEQKMQIASTTKIMTALLALENSHLNDVVTISNRAAWVGGSSMKLKKGELLSMEALLYGLMLRSGNDAAVAIAEHIAGSVEAFAIKMNEKAKQIGLKNSNFKTPHGLDTEEQYSTAKDLAILTRYALKNQDFSRIVSTDNIYVGNRSMQNTNELLLNYPGANGVKTGYTGLAGRCLVASATRNGMKIISVVLQCPDKKTRALASRRILDYCFETYTMVNVISKGDFVDSIKVNKGREPRVNLWAMDSVIMPLSREEDATLHFKVNLPTILNAPIEKNFIAGSLTALIGFDILSDTQVISKDSIDKKSVVDFWKQLCKSWMKNEKFLLSAGI